MDPPSRGDPDAAGPPEVIAGRYRLDRPLGTSRMAEVFVATDLELQRPVAVKRLPPAATHDATAKARFAREARALARVNDVNVVTVFDIVVEEGRPCLVMELVDGMTLRQLLDREGRLDPERVSSIAVGICSGLAAMHARDIVHRDLKPSNVFLMASGVVKIGDLGIARLASDATLTRTGEVFGSAPYVSPEQVTGEPVDARADLYALGCVMFEMATGRPPFQGDEPAALAYRHVHAPPDRADAIVPQVPRALASTIDRLLAKDPADRPDSADAVRHRLQALHPSTAADPQAAGTQPMEAPVATDVLPVLPAAPPPAAAGPRRPRSPREASSNLWIGALVLGILVLLMLNAWWSGADPATQARSPAQRPSPSATPAHGTPSSKSADAGSVAERAAALFGLVQELGSSGAIGERLARDLEHGVDEIGRALDADDGGKLLEALDHLRDKVAKGVDRGEISPEDAQRLDEAIGSVAAAVDAEEGEDEDG